MNIGFPPAQIGTCGEFRDEGGNQCSKTVVVTPLRVTPIPEDSHKISFGCNHWRSCRNLDCSYCMAAMDARWER